MQSSLTLFRKQSSEWQGNLGKYGKTTKGLRLTLSRVLRQKEDEYET